MSAAYQAHDSISASSSTTVLTLPSFTLTLSDRNLAVGTALRVSSARTISSIVRGSDTFESKASAHEPNSQLLVYNSTNEPQTATATLAITINSATGTWSAGYIATDGVNQTTRFAGLQSDLGTSVATGTASGTVTSAVGDLICTALCVSGVTSLTATGTGHTKRIDEPITTVGEFAMGSAPGAASLAVGYSWDSATVSKVFYGWNHLASAVAPVNTVPVDTLGIFMTSDSATQISSVSPSTAISVVDAAGLTTCQVYCTSGDLTVTLSGSVVISAGANGSSDLTLGSGASTAEFNTVLATLTYQGDADFHGTDTINVVSTGTGGSDTDTFDVLNDPRSITLTATEPNFSSLVTAVASAEMRMDEDRQSATCTITATDDDALTDVQIVTLQIAQEETIFPYRNLAVPTARRRR